MLQFGTPSCPPARRKCLADQASCAASITPPAAQWASTDSTSAKTPEDDTPTFLRRTAITSSPSSPSASKAGWPSAFSVRTCFGLLLCLAFLLYVATMTRPPRGGAVEGTTPVAVSALSHQVSELQSTVAAQAHEAAELRVQMAKLTKAAESAAASAASAASAVSAASADSAVSAASTVSAASADSAASAAPAASAIPTRVGRLKLLRSAQRASAPSATPVVDTSTASSQAPSAAPSAAPKAAAPPDLVRVWFVFDPSPLLGPAVELFWLSGNETERHYSTLPAGQRVVELTPPGNCWRARAQGSGHHVLSYCATRAAEQTVYIRAQSPERTPGLASVAGSCGLVCHNVCVRSRAVQSLATK